MVLNFLRILLLQSRLPEEALRLENITKSLLVKAQTSWSCLKERKVNSLKRGKVVQVVIADEVVGLRGVDEEQAGSPETGSEAIQVVVVSKAFLVHGVGLAGVNVEQYGSPEKELRLECKKNVLLKARTWSYLIERKLNSLKRGEVVQVVIVCGVVLVHGVGLIGIDVEQSRSPEKALHLECIMNVLLKARTFGSCFIERKFNSLKRGEVVQVVVTDEVVGLRGADDKQSQSPEKALRLECIMNVLEALRPAKGMYKIIPAILANK